MGEMKRLKRPTGHSREKSTVVTWARCREQGAACAKGQGTVRGAGLQSGCLFPAKVIMDRDLTYLTLNFLIVGLLQGSNKIMGVNVV